MIYIYIFTPFICGLQTTYDAWDAVDLRPAVASSAESVAPPRSQHRRPARRGWATPATRLIIRAVTIMTTILSLLSSNFNF